MAALGSDDMGKSKEPADLKAPDQDALVEQLAPDPSDVPEVTVMSGFLGHSPRREFWRLYLTPALDEYAEFPKADVVHSQRLDRARSPLGGTIVWVRRESTLLHTRTVLRQIQVGFLRGDIASAFLPAVIPEASLRRSTNVLPQPTMTAYCPYTYRPSCSPRTFATCYLGCTLACPYTIGTPC